MKTNQKFVLLCTVVLVTIVYGCKQADASSEESYDSKNSVLEEAVVENEEVAKARSSSVDAEPKNSNRKFLRTASIKFKVKNVAKSTENIENVTNKLGGFVTYTNLESNVNDKTETRVSQDSILETVRYTVSNSITIRVPNAKLDTVIKTIAKEIDFLDSRLINSNDVSLQLLANEMAQKRNTNSRKRIANAIDTKGKKLNQIIDAEENIEAKNEAIDHQKIENLSLQDQVNYSTLSLEIYQRESIKNTLFASEKSINNYRPHLGMQIWDSAKTGWYMLESVIAFVIQLWAVFLIFFLIWLGYKRLNSKKI
ncbi:MAG: DUF4349 domain-containing protein [Flavobacterium sp.]